MVSMARRATFCALWCVLSALKLCALREAHAQTEPATLLPSTIVQPADAARLAGIGDFAAAAEALENVGSALPPDARAIAWGQATQLRLALDDAPGAQRDLTRVLELARVEPTLRSRAWALVEYVGARCERSVPDTPGTSIAPAVVARRERLRECLRVYNEAAVFFGEDAPIDVRVRVRITTARVERALGDLIAARTLTRQAIALYRAAYPDDSAVDVDLDGHDPYTAMLDARRREAARSRPVGADRGGTSVGRSFEAAPPGGTYGERTPCEGSLDGVLPSSVRARACDAVAEGRLSVALDDQHRLDAPFPRWSSSGSRREYDAWVASTLTPWVDERVFRLQRLDGPLAAVIHTGSGAWALPAFATRAQAFLNFGLVIRSARPPPDIVQSPQLREILDGHNSGYDGAFVFIEEAVDGFMRCVRAATRVYASAWLRHCEAQLDTIDRRRFPLPDEATPALQTSTLSASQVRPSLARRLR